MEENKIGINYGSSNPFMYIEQVISLRIIKTIEKLFEKFDKQSFLVLILLCGAESIKKEVTNFISYIFSNKIVCINWLQFLNKFKKQKLQQLEMKKSNSKNIVFTPSNIFWKQFYELSQNTNQKISIKYDKCINNIKQVSKTQLEICEKWSNILIKVNDLNISFEYSLNMIFSVNNESNVTFLNCNLSNEITNMYDLIPFTLFKNDIKEYIDKNKLNWKGNNLGTQKIMIKLKEIYGINFDIDYNFEILVIVLMAGRDKTYHLGHNKSISLFGIIFENNFNGNNVICYNNTPKYSKIFNEFKQSNEVKEWLDNQFNNKNIYFLKNNIVNLHSDKKDLKLFDIFYDFVLKLNETQEINEIEIEVNSKNKIKIFDINLVKSERIIENAVAETEIKDFVKGTHVTRKIEGKPAKTIIDTKVEFKKINEVYKDFSTLYLKQKDQFSLLNVLNNFKNKKEIYSDLGLPYKFGALLHGSPGTGKCHSKDTPILMFDGTIKMVQDVKVGDVVMGDDSTPRKVISLGRGKDTMYKIINVKGESYIVNSEHILSLKYSSKKFITDRINRNSYSVKWFNNKLIKLESKTFKYTLVNKNEIYIQAEQFLNNINENLYVDICIKDYLNLNKSIKEKLKGYKVPINFKEQKLNFDPYIIGLWLGDGSSRNSKITNQDSTILHYLANTLPKYNCYLQYQYYETNNYNYNINGNGIGNKNCNNFLNELKNENLLNNKHIPMIYKCNSRKNRLKLLAGLLDSDGNLDKCGCFDFIQKSEKLIDDIIYLCRSLGFACYKSKCKKRCLYKGIYKEGDYFRICISGEGIHEIPTLCPRKKANPRKQIKDVLVSGIKVEKLNKDNYYGFELDGNHRYVMGDFTVTHNSATILAVASYLQRDICYFDLSKISSNDELKLVFNEINTQLNKNAIIVFEDIDAMTNIVHCRTSKTQNNGNLTLECILNLLQGTLTHDGCIFLVTTNHLEKLDPAFYRDARFDVKINLEPCDHYQFNLIYKKFFNRNIPKELLLKIPENTITPATFITKLLPYLLSKENDSIIIKEFIEVDTENN
jgi:ATP-dependent 26S proteasome regulatory subunit